MGVFIGYMVQVSIIMTILFLVYKFLLAGLSFHSFNRKIIIGIYILSWILPAAVVWFSQSATQSALTEINMGVVTNVMIADMVYDKKIEWADLIMLTYICGILFMTFVTLISIWRMVDIIRKARMMESTKYFVKISHCAPCPFSWGKYIILRESDIDDSLGMVIVHEATHLRKWHWIDLIPVRVTIILQWFSPAAWLLAKELREVHEFEVDEIAAEDNFYEYQLMLIKKTAGSRFPVFADSLNHSQIKKRLTMMRKKSNPKRRGVAIVLPLAACAAVMLVTQPVIARVISRLEAAEIFSFIDGKINENDQNLQIEVISGLSGISDGTVSQKSPSLSADYPRINSFASTDDELFIDTSMSDVSATNERRSDNPKNTYLIDGKDHISSISANDLSMNVSVQKKLISPKEDDSSDENIFLDAEKTAQFKGGENELLAFLIENIKYPESEMKSPEDVVKVIVSFNILTDGMVDNIVVRKSGGKAYDAEAVEVIKKTSGRWEPAENNGKPVVSMFTIPITFKMKR